MADPGVFLSFEGPEGSGKTTQVNRLHAEFLHAGVDVLLVREPGGTELSETVRRILLDPATGPLTPWTELCLYVAARAQLVDHVIRPALRAGRVVLADRYGDSSVVYQGVARGIGAETVEEVNRLATGGLLPARTVLFDVPPELGLARIAGRGRPDRLEAEPLAFHRRVREGYLELARRWPDRFLVLDASGTEEDVFAALRHGLDGLLPGWRAASSPGG